MSFIDTYIKKHRVGDISKASRKNLDQLEKTLTQVTAKSETGLSFLDAIKEYGDQIGDLIERVQQEFDGFKLSFSSLKLVYSVAIEVYQIVNEMRDRVVPAGVTGEAAWDVQLKFGQDLTYFIWKAVGPFDKKYNWIPFKKTIERKLVKWLAGMGLEAARKLFSANKEVASFSSNNIPGFMRAL